MHSATGQEVPEPEDAYEECKTLVHGLCVSTVFMVDTYGNLYGVSSQGVLPAAQLRLELRADLRASAGLQ